MFREKKESRLLIVLKGGKVEFQATNIDMVELATMCGALERLWVWKQYAEEKAWMM